MSVAVANNRNRPKAMIVDDDPAVVAFLRSRCIAMGLEVQVASNGVQALMLARRDPPDVLIVDVRMPELDGLSLCARILEPNRKGIDVIVMSGAPEDETFERCQSFGATYARKGPELWSTVRATLSKMFPGATMRPQESTKPDPTSVRERPLILVLDDDPDVAKFLVSRLRKCGVDAVHASDGREGYALAVREKPAVIISDYSMPGGDIHFLLWRLRSTPGIDKTPVFAMTGYDLDKPTTERLMRGSFGQRGVDRIFKKPLDVHDMFVAIQKCCALQYGSNGNANQKAKGPPAS